MKTKLMSVCLFVFLFSIIFLLLGCFLVDKPPKLNIPDKTVDEGQVLQFDLKQYTEYKDKNALVFTIVSGVGEITVATYTYTPDYDVLKKVREYNPAAESVDFEVSISAKDGKGREATATFTIRVTDVNRPPVLDIPDQTINEGETLTLDLLDYTADPDTLDTFTYNLISGVGNIEGSTYTYTSPYTDAGTKTVTVRVTDNKIGTDQRAFGITVNRLPVLNKLSGPSGTINHISVTFSWIEDDPDGNIISYEYKKDEGSWNYHVPSTIYKVPSTSYTWTGYSEGEHKFEFRVQDNKGAYSNVIGWTFNYVKNPVVVGEMVLVEKGSFTMGTSGAGEFSNEKPAHQVTLTYDFEIGKYEVTFNEYDAFCNATGRSKPKDEGWGRGNRPVIYVGWWDALAYCNWLSEKEGLPVAYRLMGESAEGQTLDASGNVTTDITKVVGYRLPTEAEWEYAARGGKYHSPYKYSGSDNVDDVAWYYNYNYLEGKTNEVGLKLPNALGTYDMSGNVWEWCSDWFDFYTGLPETNPFNSTDGIRPVSRGGSWNSSATYTRVAFRYCYKPAYVNFDLGFRICRTVP